jgi:hypothetical protein
MPFSHSGDGVNRNVKIQKNPEVVARALAKPDGGVLLHLETGAYFGVNQVGLLVWELVDGERTLEEIIAVLRTRVTNGPPELEQDVERFIDSVVQRDLVRVID